MDLSNVHVAREVLSRHGLRPKHKLGQNFLVNRGVLDAIVKAVDATKNDLVLEIGPGIGTLTTAVAPTAGKVVAIELDRGLLPVLAETLAPYPHARVIHGDVMQVDLAKLIQEERLSGEVHVAANLPYYITTPILMRLLEERLPLSRIVVMVQKEVADRMVARPASKDYGALSVAIQYYTTPQVVVRVSRGSFLPAPEVESSVVQLTVRTEPPVEADPTVLFRVVKAAFGQRRKTLNNALLSLGIDKDRVAAVLGAAGVDGQRRGETLALEEFAAIARALTAEVDTKSP
jgi:16S rRNA (adenine1518-N6/adenine1519-N6)-dimethyltransferase